MRAEAHLQAARLDAQENYPIDVEWSATHGLSSASSDTTSAAMMMAKTKPAKPNVMLKQGQPKKPEAALTMTTSKGS